MTTRKARSNAAHTANKRQKSSDAENVAPISTAADAGAVAGGKGKGKAKAAPGGGGSAFHDQTVADYLKGRCESMCQEIQDHADGLIVRLKGEYERQAAEVNRRLVGDPCVVHAHSSFADDTADTVDAELPKDPPNHTSYHIASTRCEHEQ